MKINLAPVKPTISFNEFDRIDICVGTIDLVEEVIGSNKLVKMAVNFGDHKR